MAIPFRSGDRRNDHRRFRSTTNVLSSLFCHGALDAPVLLSRPFRAGIARAGTEGIPATHPGNCLPQPAPAVRGMGTGGHSWLPWLAFVQPDPRTAAESGVGGGVAIVFSAEPLAHG